MDSYYSNLDWPDNNGFTNWIRGRFLNIVKNLKPAVLTDLHDEPFKLYAILAAKTSIYPNTLINYLANEENKYIEEAYALNSALHNWARGYNLEVPWVLERAFCTLHNWTTLKSGAPLTWDTGYAGGKHPVIPDPPSGLPTYRLGSERPEHYLRRVQAIYEARIPEGMESMSVVTARREFIRAILSEAEDYCHQIESRSLEQGWKEVFNKPNLFRDLNWAAQALVLGKTSKVIAEESGEDFKATEQALRRILRSLGLSRKRGRPKKMILKDTLGT